MNTKLRLLLILAVLGMSGALYANDPPELTVPADTQVVNEGDSLGFGVSASDPDGDSVILLAEGLPAGAVFVDNGDGTGSFSWEPGYCDSGVYEVRFIARDVGSPVLADTDYVEIEVVEVDRAPEVSDPGIQSVLEGDTLEFSVTCSDPDSCDSDMVYLEAEDLPTGASFESDTGNPATGTFTWVPGYDQAGVYYVRFIGYDMRTPALADTVVVEIDVGETGNHAPVFDSLPDQTLSEGETLVVRVVAHDPDGDSITMMWYYPTLDGATFVDSGNGIGSFTYIPDYYSADVKNITFYARDDRDPPLTGNEGMTITVLDVNQPPVIDSIGDKKVKEGDTLVIHVHASDPTDPDGGPLYLSVMSIPPNASFTDNGDGTGDFVFTPDYDQAGVYNITFVCTDADTPQLSGYEQVEITVIDVDRAPVLDSIGYYVLNEGDTLVDTITAYDPDGDSIVLSVDTLPANASFQDLGNDTGIFFFAPAYWQAGIYTVTFTASDGKLSDFEVVPIQVLEIGNHTPILDSIGPKEVMEGETLQFTAHAFDPDSDSLVLMAENLPVHASFVDNGDGSGDFLFTPNYLQSGVYLVTFIATDLDSADTEVVTITVHETGDHPPVINVPADTQYVREADTLVFDVSATDVEGDSIFFTVESAPANSYYEDHGDGTLTFSFYPDYFQAGVYDVVFIATDDSLLSDTGVVTIVVHNVDRKPEIDTILTQHIYEGDTLILTITAHDPDHDSIWLWIYPTIPNMSFTDNGDGTATFFYAPDYNASGIHGFWVFASDGELEDTTFFSVVVHNTNRPPVLDSIGPQSVVEGETLTFNVTAHDPDGTRLNLYATPLPANASFQDLGNDTGVFFFTPDYTQAGMYNVYFIADDGGLADSELVVITVFDAGNQRPYLDSIPPQTVDEGDTLEVLVVAHDPDGIPPYLESGPLPENASFTDNGDGTGTFLFIPACDQAGSYSVYFVAIDRDDSTFQDTVTMSITVNDVNHPPVLELSSDSFDVVYGDTLQVTLIAHDPEAIGGCDSLTFEVLRSPGGALLSVDETTCVYTWVVDKAHIGPNLLVVRGDDGHGGVDTVVAVIRNRGLIVSKPVEILRNREDVKIHCLLQPIGSNSKVGFYFENVSTEVKLLRINHFYVARNPSYLGTDFQNMDSLISYLIGNLIGLAPGERTPVFWLDKLMSVQTGQYIRIDYEQRSTGGGWISHSEYFDYENYAVDPGDSIYYTIPVSSSAISLVKVIAGGPSDWDITVLPDSFMVTPHHPVWVVLHASVPDTASFGGEIELSFINVSQNDTIVLVRDFLLDGFEYPSISTSDTFEFMNIVVDGDFSLSSGDQVEVNNSVTSFRLSDANVEIEAGSRVEVYFSSFKGLELGGYHVNAAGAFRAYLCNFQNCKGITVNSDEFSMENISVINGSNFALYINGPLTDYIVSDVYVDTISGDGLVIDMLNDLTLQNVWVQNCTGNDVVLNSSNVTYIDGEIDTSKVVLNGNSVLDRAFSLYLTVLDRDSLALDSVHVTIHDARDSLVFEGYTDSTYTLGPIYLNRFRIFPDSLIDYSPFVVELQYSNIDTIITFTPERMTFMTIVILGQAFIRGDANADGTVNVSDVVYITKHLTPPMYFPCEDAADADDNGILNVSDAVFALNHIAPAPSFPPPNVTCGFDPTEDSLECEAFPPCGSKEMAYAPGRLAGLADVLIDRIDFEDNTFVVPVILENDIKIAGYQVEIDYNSDSYRLCKVKFANFAMNVTDDLHKVYIDSVGGKVTVVNVVTIDPEKLSQGRNLISEGAHVLFYLLFEKKRDEFVPSLIHDFEAVLSDPDGKSIYPKKVFMENGIMGREIAAPEIQMELLGPNPFADLVKFRLALPGEARVEFNIYDASGRKVRTVLDGVLGEGSHMLYWDGKNERGLPLPSGIYSFEVRVNGRRFRIGKINKVY